MWLGLSSKTRDAVEVSTIAETRVKDRLAKLPGVSEVIIGGESRYSMRVWIDSDRLTAQGLTVADVETALRRGNVELPSGRVEGAGRELTVKTLGELTTSEGFADMVVSESAGRPIRLRDVARVQVGAEDERKVIRYQGEPAVGLGIVRQSKANTLDVAAAVKGEIERLRAELPPDLRIENSWDSSIFIDRSIADVRTTIFEAILLVVLVIYLFLRSVRATIVPVIAIPMSIIGTFTALDLLGFSINTLTLMGMTLAIGVVVDDAIVVLENVSRWIEDGTPPMEAARKGMAEISFAVIAATVSVIAVFVPLAFLSTATGKLFREFGLTVAVSVAISGFVALTLSPMLCARVLRRHEAEHGVKAWLARGFEAMAEAYAKTLRPTLRFRGTTLVLGLAWFLAGIGLYWIADREFIPDADRGLVRRFTRAPEGSTLGYTDRYMRQVDGLYRAVPEMDSVFSVVGLGLGIPGLVNEGAVFAMLKPWEQRAPHAASDRRGAAPEALDRAGHVRVRDEPARPRSRLLRATRSRWCCRDPTRASSRAWRKSWCSAPQPCPAWCSRRTTCRSTSRSSRSTSTAIVLRTSASRSATSPPRCRSSSAASTSRRSSSTARPTR